MCVYRSSLLQGEYIRRFTVRIEVKHISGVKKIKVNIIQAEWERYLES